jgi:tripartite-type tricarboxylate transporter receptor subunit TctC
VKPLRIAACLAALAAAGASHAQTYPDGNVRVVVPYPAGGPTDVMARLVAQKLSEALGQQFYVENLPGASATIGTAAVANAPADGRTILFGTQDFLLQPIVKAKAPYDAVKNFAPVVLVASAAEMIAVNPSVPAKNASCGQAHKTGIWRDDVNARRRPLVLVRECGSPAALGSH